MTETQTTVDKSHKTLSEQTQTQKVYKEYFHVFKHKRQAEGSGHRRSPKSSGLTPGTSQATASLPVWLVWKSGEGGISVGYSGGRRHRHCPQRRFRVRGGLHDDREHVLPTDTRSSSGESGGRAGGGPGLTVLAPQPRRHTQGSPSQRVTKPPAQAARFLDTLHGRKATTGQGHGVRNAAGWHPTQARTPA